MRCSRSPDESRPRQVDRTVSTPDSVSNDRSWPIIVSSCASHQSRATNRRITPSRLPPCQMKMPSGRRTLAHSATTRSSSRGSRKKPNDVKRFTTASKRAVHRLGNARMSARVYRSVGPVPRAFARLSNSAEKSSPSTSNPASASRCAWRPCPHGTSRILDPVGSPRSSIKRATSRRSRARSNIGPYSRRYWASK